jgi:hypothetical protein
MVDYGLAGIAGARGGAARSPFQSLIERMAQVIKEALEAYRSEVVMVTYANLGSAAAKRAMVIEWDRILHAKYHLTATVSQGDLDVAYQAAGTTQRLASSEQREAAARRVARRNADLALARLNEAIDQFAKHYRLAPRSTPNGRSRLSRSGRRSPC